MRKFLIICAAVLQVFLLAFIGGQREYVLRTGKTIYLRTVPVDPRDLFRGDYVRLRYDISSIERKYFRDGLANQAQTGEKYSYRKYRGKPVYTILKVDDSNLSSIDYVTDKKPLKGQLYIRGRQDYSYDNSLINVLYGIEAYFVEQGKGEQLQNMTSRNNHIAFDMELALGSNGIAVLKGYRRAPLAIKIEDIERKEGILQSCRLVLTNISNKPVAIVDLPDNSSLKLEIWSSTNIKKVRWINEDAPLKKIEDKDVHILQPKQDYEFKVNFNDPYWSVAETGKESTPIAINTFKDSTRSTPFFSLVYQSPSVKQCKDLKDANSIWHGKLTIGRLRGMQSPFEDRW